jgi:signal transduction histidine kinase
LDLAQFINAQRGAIVAEWEKFARTQLPAAAGMTRVALRDHADEILSAIVADLESSQSAGEQAEKSKGRGDAQRLGAMGKIHATLRIEFGFKLGQLVAEYRALRASVLRLWQNEGTDPAGVTRFNEAIDEALTEAVHSFTTTTEHYRDQTIGILGHDLRNPLAAIVTGATMLVGAEELSDRSVRIAARMLNSANRMNRMIADLLDWTRSRFGDAIPIARAPIDLDPLCRQVIAELEGLRPEGSVQFVPQGELTGEWDSDRISQVISNLVRNAIQHGGRGEPIRLVALDHGDEVVLEVHNGGPAIPSAALATIFEPTVRHVNKGNTTGGLGLGLYIATQIVLAHGGRLEASSGDRDGTTFSVHLPRRAPPAHPSSAPPAP